MNVAIYARYSTDKQDARSIEDQVRKCREHAKAKGWTVSDLFSDEAISGSHREREGLKRLLVTAGQKGGSPFARVLVDDLSRLSRDLWDLGTIVFQDLALCRVHLIDVSTGMSSDDPNARMMFATKGLINDAFLENVRRQTHRGLEGRALAGYWTGGRVYGFRTVKEPNPSDADHPRAVPQIEPDQAEVVRRIFREFVSGVGLGRIADALNRDGIQAPYDRSHTKRAGKGWGQSTIRSVLTNERYMGRWVWNKRKYSKGPGGTRRGEMRPASEWRVREVPELAIVDADLWREAQERLKENTVRVRRTKSGERYEHLLSGLLRCGECGSSMQVVSAKVKNGTRYANFGCAARHTKGEAICSNRRYVSELKIERAIIGSILDVLSAPDLAERVERSFVARFTELNRQAAGGGSLQKEQAEAEKHVRNLTQAIGRMGLTEALEESLREAEERRRSLRARASAVRSKPAVLPTRAMVAKAVASSRDLILKDPQRKREFLRRHVGRIVLTPETESPGHSYRATGAIELSGLLGAGVLDTNGCGGRI